MSLRNTVTAVENYEWPETAQKLADMVRSLDGCPASRVRYLRTKIRHFLEGYGCTVMPWANARTSRRSRHIRDAQGASNQTAPRKAAQPEREGALQRHADGDCAEGKIISIAVELSATASKAKRDVHGGEPA